MSDLDRDDDLAPRVVVLIASTVTEVKKITVTRCKDYARALAELEREAIAVVKHDTTLAHVRRGEDVINVTTHEDNTGGIDTHYRISIEPIRGEL